MSAENAYILQRIRALIDAKGLKHNKVANDLGLSKSSFSAMLSGKKILRVEYLPCIARTLGCTYNDLFAEPEEWNGKRSDSNHPVGLGEARGA